MWYPSLPDLLQLHDRICAVREVPRRVTDMSAVDEAILAPQRAAAEEDRTAEVVARKCTVLMIPLVCKRPFDNCNDRVAYSIGQRFTDRNGFMFRASVSEVMPVFEHMRNEEVARDAVATWIESHLSTRFDATHRERIFSALNALAEVKEDLEAIPGLQDDIERMDDACYVVAQQAASLFRLDREAKEEVQQRHPAFWEAWKEALVMKE